MDKTFGKELLKKAKTLTKNKKKLPQEVAYMWHYSLIDATKFINIDNKYPNETGKLYDFEQRDKAILY
ncbi:hypothetical protein QUF55_08815 [Clostridiaceae bacterium HSG29]|nr:hypothetical protein [Clostridiaceae bacterium HSG29]